MVLKDWDISSDCIDDFAKTTTQHPVGEAIITSKCKLNKDNGFLIVSNNGLAWRIRPGMGTGFYDFGKSKWIRWCDISDITPKKDGQVTVEIKVRKKGELITDKNDNPKTIKWDFTLTQNNNEEKYHFKEREDSFYDILSEIYKKNSVEIDPPTSDSVI